MFLPIGDEPNDHVRMPVVVWGLIGLNLLVAFVTLGKTQAAQVAIWMEWGFNPEHFSPVTLITHMFLHQGWMHLIGNMLFLWIFGDNIESRLGHLGFLAAYLGTGVVAMGLHGLLSDQGGIGASGAVTGVMGLYFVACPGAKVRILIWLYVFIQIVLIPARGLMLVWFFLQDVLPVLVGAKDNVAHWAHIGGFGAGVVIMLLLLPVVGRSEPPVRPSVNVRYHRRNWSEEEEA
jgi:membrane associated rhomboid family serine protease